MSKLTTCRSLVPWYLDYKKDLKVEGLSFDRNNLIVSIKLCSLITCLYVLILYVNHKKRQIKCSVVFSRCIFPLLNSESPKAVVENSA